MIYCENEAGKVLIDDEFNIKTNKSNYELIKILINDLDLAPENGSPTLILQEKLKNYGFKILDIKLPVFEDINGMIF